MRHCLALFCFSVLLTVTLVHTFWGRSLSLTVNVVQQQEGHGNDEMKKRVDFDVQSCDDICQTGVPCEYKDEVDLRIIVLTYNRALSLAKCLSHIEDLDSLGERVAVEIWIDRRDDSVDEKTLNIAQNFSQSWRGGRACVHVQDKRAYIVGQWIDTWRPKPNTSEIGLILEDDIDIAPLAYKWLKSVKAHFKGLPDLAGYALQMENIQTKRGKIRKMSGPASDVVYLWRMFATWGYAPNPEFWRAFQDWFHITREKDLDFRPYVPNLISTKWFKDAERNHEHPTIWALWFTYFCDQNRRFTVHPNLMPYTGRRDVLLDTNRHEKGLHYTAKQITSNAHLLLRKWNSSFETFPLEVKRYGFDGEILQND